MCQKLLLIILMTQTASSEMGVKVAGEEETMQECFLKANKRCSKNGQLDFTIQTKDEVQSFRGWSQLTYLCSFVERLSIHPSDAKCMNSETPINCYDCIHPNSLIGMHNRNRLVEKFASPESSNSEGSRTISKSHLVRIASSVISLSFCLLFTNLVKTGKTKNCYIPILFLFVFSLISLVEVAIDSLG